MSPFPSNEALLCKFVAFLAVCCNTIKVYLAAVRQLNIQQGHAPPDISQMPRLHQVLRGIKVVSGSAQAASKRPERLPITPSILRAIKTHWESQPLTKDRIMLWAAFTTCFFGFMRSGEICTCKDELAEDTTALDFRDVAIDSFQEPSLMRIHLRKSRTDPFYVGTDIVLAATKDDLCPVGALLLWLAKRGHGPGPLFQFSSGAPLTHPLFVTKLQKALSEAGISPTGFLGHSFCSGVATLAAQKGFSDTHIKQLERWKSQAYHCYIKPNNVHLARLASTLSSDSSSQGKNA